MAAWRLEGQTIKNFSSQSEAYMWCKTQTHTPTHTEFVSRKAKSNPNPDPSPMTVNMENQLIEVISCLAAFMNNSNATSIKAWM